MRQSGSIWQSQPLVATARRLTVSSLLTQERFEFREERVFAIEHIIERGHRHRLRAPLAQETAERIELGRWAVQRDHARRGRRTERSHDAKAVMGLRQHRRVASGEAGADLAVFPGTRAGGDMVEDDARGL